MTDIVSQELQLGSLWTPLRIKTPDSIAMSTPLDPDSLKQLRALLEHLEHSQPFYDKRTAAALRHVILARIRALEAAQRVPSEQRLSTQKRTKP